MKRWFTATVMAAALFACTVQAAETKRVIIEVQAGRMAAVEQLLAVKGIKPLHRFEEFDALVVSAPSSFLEQLARHPLVRHIELDAPRYPMDQEVPYGIDMVQARDVWDADDDDVIDSGAPTGEGRTVCIIDSGIDADHPDLAGVNLLGGMPEGWDSDTCGHGTHVAGTIAAVQNSIGVVGVSPGQVNLYIAKVFDGAECAWSFSSGISAAALQCLRAGADVVNMSLGGGRPTRIENRTFQLLLQRGVLPVASAGNGGNMRYSFPASYPSVMSVAAWTRR